VKQIVLAITGASGSLYARRLAQELARSDLHLHLVTSPAGQRVLREELGPGAATLEGLLGQPAENVSVYAYEDIGARVASGSFLTDGMIICPCSSSTLAAVAAGLAENLIWRAAAVTLKEARRLILVTREMPLSQIDLANMLRVSQAGGIICPASPGLYMRPRSIDDLADFVAGRVLDLLAIPHHLNTRWPASGSPPTAPASGQELC
jgi:4-hydroxy-3-polyprenylbenzoate decarboxylase